MSEPSDLFGILETSWSNNPDATAVVFGARPLDYRSLHATVLSLAASIKEIGIEPGDRIALMERNSPAFLIWTFAVNAVGAILVPLNCCHSAAKVSAILEDSAPSLVVSHWAFKAIIDGATDSQPWLLRATIGPERNGGDCPMGLQMRPTLAKDFVPHASAEDDVAHLYYTSGKAGEPKGVPLSQRDVVSHAMAAAGELNLAPGDVWGHFAPMFHLADAWATIAVTAVGATHAFLPEFDPREALKLIEGTGVTATSLLPEMLQQMLLMAQTEAKYHDLGSLRLLISGGAPISPESVRAVLEIFSSEYVQTYALTETCPFLALSILEPRHLQLPKKQQLALRSRIGRALKTVELDVVDERGRPVARDGQAIGEIVARGSSISPPCWNRPEETANALRNGWFHTGDLATIDENSCVNFVDRKKDVIVSDQENVLRGS